MGRLIAQTLGMCREHASEALSLQGLDYRPAGPFKMDLDAINAAPPDRQEVQGRIHATMIEGAHLALLNAEDHVLALEGDVVRDPAPIWSPLTLCRAVLEATVVTCHLLDPSITITARLARIAALWLDDSSLAERSARTFGSVPAEGVQKYGQFKLSELATGGFSVERDAKNRPVRIRFGDATAPLGLNITDEATKLLPAGMPSPYRLGSGAAHSRPWLLEMSVTKTSDGDRVGETATAETAAFTAMFCMRAYVAAWGAYFGLQVNESVDAIDEAMLVLGRGIISDDAHRKAG